MLLSELEETIRSQPVSTIATIGLGFFIVIAVAYVHYAVGRLVRRGPHDLDEQYNVQIGPWMLQAKKMYGKERTTPEKNKRRPQLSR